MKRTTIFLPEQVEKDLHHYARVDNRPTASLVREALEDYVAKRSTPRSLPSFAGQFASGRRDTAEHHDDVLFKTLTPHGQEPKAGTKPRSSRSPARRKAGSR